MLKKVSLRIEFHSVSTRKSMSEERKSSANQYPISHAKPNTKDENETSESIGCTDTKNKLPNLSPHEAPRETMIN